MDSKFSFSRVFRITFTELNKWLINSRMLIAACMVIFIWSFAIEPLTEISREMNSPLNFAEPFIAVFNSRTLCLVTPAVYVFLISDYPHLDRNSLFILHRVNKREWIMGQFLFFLLSSFIFMLIILVFSIVPVMNSSFAANGWSIAVTRYEAQFPEKANSFSATLITKELYNQIAPYQAAIVSFMLNWFYMLFLAVVLLLFHTLNMKKAGVPVIISIIGIGSALAVFKSEGMWYFPMAHSMTNSHFTKYFKETVTDLSTSFIYFGITILILLIMSMLMVKKTNFLNIDDNE